MVGNEKGSLNISSDDFKAAIHITMIGVMQIKTKLSKIPYFMKLPVNFFIIQAFDRNFKNNTEAIKDSRVITMDKAAP